MKSIPEKIEFTNEPPGPEDIPEWRMDRFVRGLIRATRQWKESKQAAAEAESRAEEAEEQGKEDRYDRSGIGASACHKAAGDLAGANGL